MQTSPVWITGADGWLGTNLLAALHQGIAGVPGVERPFASAKLHCLVAPGSEPHAEFAGGRVERREGDVRDAAAVERFFGGSKSSPQSSAEGGTVFHLAGIIHPRRVRDLEDVNVTGTRHVLEAARRAGARRAVVMSSNSPLGCNPHPDHLFDEQSPYHPYMGYGRSKMRMEELVNELGAEGPMETVLVRAPWFYGPYQPARQVLFFRMIQGGKAPIVGSGESRRSMAYLENLAQGLLLAATVEAAAGRTYWIADERPYSMNEVTDTIERLMETEFGLEVAHKRLRLPHFAGSVATVLDGLIQRTGLYHQKMHVLSEMNKTIACAIDRAKAELGYAPTVSLEEGMRRSLVDARERHGFGR